MGCNFRHTVTAEEPWRPGEGSSSELEVRTGERPRLCSVRTAALVVRLIELLTVNQGTWLPSLGALSFSF